MKHSLPTLLLGVSLAIPAKAQIDPQIPHIAQGHGWTTILRAINHCDEKAQFQIGLYGQDGEPLKFAFARARDGKRYAAIRSRMYPREIQKFTFMDTESELIQGFGEIFENDGDSYSRQCVAFELEYWQTLSDGTKRFATVPVRTQEPLRSIRQKRFVLSFVNTPNCHTAIALAGNQSFSDETVTVEARARDGGLLDTTNLGRTWHTAFSLYDKLPAVQTYMGQELMGTIHITGADSVVALDFCNGKLAQFRLPHLASSD